MRSACTRQTEWSSPCEGLVPLNMKHKIKEIIISGNNYVVEIFKVNIVLRVLIFFFNNNFYYFQSGQRQQSALPVTCDQASLFSSRSGFSFRGGKERLIQLLDYSSAAPN